MPALLLRIANGDWGAAVANTGIVYPFEGATLAEQAGNVQSFAEAMVSGDLNSIVYYINAEGFTPEVVAQQLFGECDILFLSGESIWGADGGIYIIDQLAEVGAVLLAALE